MGNFGGFPIEINGFILFNFKKYCGTLWNMRV